MRLEGSSFATIMPPESPPDRVEKATFKTRRGEVRGNPDDQCVLFVSSADATETQGLAELRPDLVHDRNASRRLPPPNPYWTTVPHLPAVQAVPAQQGSVVHDWP
jgi:hypothetical protein